jgi:hypothetical protein
MRRPSSPRWTTLVRMVISSGVRMFWSPRNIPWPTVTNSTAGAAPALRHRSAGRGMRGPCYGCCAWCVCGS